MKVITADLLQSGQRILIAGKALKVFRKIDRGRDIQIKTHLGWTFMRHDERCTRVA